MLTADEIDAYHRDGFVLGGQVLDPAAVDELRKELDRVITERDGPGPQPIRVANLARDRETSAIWQVVDIFLASGPFRRLVFHEAITSVVAQLSGASALRLWHDQIQYKPESHGGVNMWHQDWPYWPVLDRPTQVTAWVALDDADEDNGCMSMVPGSHRWGDQIDLLHELTSFDDLPAEVLGHPVRTSLRPVPAGHVHFHDPLTWHGSHANESGRPRRAIALHYMTDQTVRCRSPRPWDHPLEPHIVAAVGEPVTGDIFPVVWRDGAPVAI